MKHERDKKRKPWRTGLVALACLALLACVSPRGWAAQRTPKPGVAAWAESQEALLPKFLTGLFHREDKAQNPAAVHPRALVPVGHTVGIKLFSDGVLVVGLGEVDTASGAAAPAKTCGLKEGDIITHINAQEVDTIEQVQSILAESSGETVSIRAMRGKEEVELSAQAAWCPTDGSYKLGAWIRDSMAGIGTVTFVDPETGVFGALGHGVSDVDTQQLMPLSSGAILHSAVAGVQKGQIGQPGQLRGVFDVDRDLGALYANTPCGIFGTLGSLDNLPLGPALPVAAKGEVKVGQATILSNIQGEEVREYTAEISRIYPGNPADSRNFLIKITDPALLEKTGGIVQGMSGSPILQDGKLVGAVTHVLVNDPTSGYGIFVENMLDASAP